ncbi:MAG: glycerophosphodiester phosphodiesterase [Verrucomicrobiae bacterium]|nr:glycerophosphodiester phosphodiesterase [Verrucomicrobiae bacterium]
MKRSPLVIAHRGWSGRYPENTLAAVRAAVKLGVDMVEVDVQETADGALVVFHDYGLQRIYGVNKRVRAARRKELAEAPTLSEVLRACRGRCRVLVEIKGARGEAVARAIEQAGMVDDVIVFSLRAARLEELYRANPRIMRFGLTASEPNTRVTVAGWGVSRRVIRSAVDVRRWQRRGPLFVWTVNRPTEMTRLMRWGVNGVITDHPDRALQLRATLNKLR